MPNPFDFSSYTVTPIKPYIDPLPNPVVGRFGVLKMLEKGVNLPNREGFARQVIALNLAELGIKEGVNFNPLLIQVGGTQGTYSYGSNTLAVVNRYIQDPEYLGLLLNILGHETKHKHQHEINKAAKYFSSNFDNRTVGFLKHIPTLIGEDDNARTLYLLNSAEKDSFIYGNNFAEILLSEALRGATKSGDSEVLSYLTKQLRKTSLLKNVEINEIRYREVDFIENHIPQFYANCAESFTAYLSIAQSYNNRQSLNSYQQIFYERIQNSSIADGTDYQQSVHAAASVLAYLPKREFVKDFIDFALSAIDKNVATDAMHYLTQYAIPLTPSDMTRFFVCSDMFKGPASHFSLPLTALSKIDEQFLVKNLIVSQGYETASKIIGELKTDSNASSLNFGVIDGLMAGYSDAPIFVYNDKEFAGCSQVLDFVIQRLISEGKVNSGNIYDVRAELSQNLSNIVSNFENPLANNFEFNSALERFIANPYEKQFEPNEENVDETSKALSPEVAKRSGEYTSRMSQPKKEKFDYSILLTKDDEGRVYADELIKSLEALERSLKELSEILSREEVQNTLIKISDKNSNGERVLDKDEIIKGKPQSEEVEDESAASCERFEGEDLMQQINTDTVTVNSQPKVNNAKPGSKEQPLPEIVLEQQPPVG